MKNTEKRSERTEVKRALQNACSNYNDLNGYMAAVNKIDKYQHVKNLRRKKALRRNKHLVSLYKVERRLKAAFQRVTQIDLGLNE